jgi:hypothetical protein
MSDRLKEGQDKSKGGCPNPQDRGHKSYPMRHQPAGLQNSDRRGPNTPGKEQKTKSR